MKKITILVIDDSIDDRELYKRSLNIPNGEIEVREAACGESGLKAIEENRPHCVMLDYSLPGHNGIEILKRIREKYSSLPVIILTGQGNEKIAVEAMKEGAQDYISKSLITPEALQRMVRTAIEHGNLQRRIEEQRASLEIFTHALAHDLKEPVRTIRSFLEMINDWQNLSEKSQRFFYYIRGAADRMSALIDAVYLYTRLDAAEQMEKTMCDLSSVVREVRENLAKLIEEEKTDIICDTLPHVNVNHVQMIQLFQNLITNAIKHCEKPVTVGITAKEHDNKWQIVVSDNGPGMAEEYLKKIFDPFRRMSYQKGREAGLGLGLAINKKIVESYGGRIWCESKPGEGSSFIFTLPKSTTTSAPRNIMSRAAENARIEAVKAFRKYARILLVDDNEADIELHRMMLVEEARLRCDILVARNGREALEIMQAAEMDKNQIDLVLLDLNMPVMTGFELLTLMRDEHKAIDPKVVICTTSSYDVDRQKAASYGAVDYMVKPAGFVHLKDIIANCHTIHLQPEGADFLLLRVA